MIFLLNCFPNVSVKHWCVFLSSFTVVMIILIFSTDLKNRHYIHFNNTYVWDFEEYSQESPRLIQLIKTVYIQSLNSTQNAAAKKYSQKKIKPSLQLAKIFKKKRFGIYFELGAERHLDSRPMEVEWLSTQMGWQGLLTQPHPDMYREVVEMSGPKLYTAQVCISPTIYVKHALFKTGGSDSTNSSLIPVPCFPLYSLMKAFNTTYLDLLILNRVDAPLQVLKTLPLSQVHVQTIGLVNHDISSEDDLMATAEAQDLCCSEDMTQLLEGRGYRRNFACPLQIYYEDKFPDCPREGFMKSFLEKLKIDHSHANIRKRS